MLNLLYLDIETTPVKAWVWGAYEQNIIQIVEDWCLLGFAYAEGDGKVESVYPEPEYRTLPGYYKTWEGRALNRLWGLLDDADVVIAHNGQSFDVKKVQAKLIEYGYDPPSPFLQIDTKREATRNFKFTKNNLGEIGKLLINEDKMHHNGFDMWVGCMEGRPAEWNRMERYNKKDVVLLRKIYRLMSPWMRTHPVLTSVGDEDTQCPRCGSKEPGVVRKNRRTRAGVEYKQLQCPDCGGYYQLRKQAARAGEVTTS